MPRRLIPWVKYPRIWVTLGVLVPALTTAYWFTQRTLPIEVGQPYQTPEVLAGGEVVLTVPVRRDLSHNCTATIKRTLIDSALRQHPLTYPDKPEKVSAEGLRAREELAPGWLVLPLPIPKNVSSGPATILSEAYYVCAGNPTTWVLPIENTWRWPIRILPPSP